MSILLRRHSVVGPPPPVGDHTSASARVWRSSSASGHRHSVVLLVRVQHTRLGVKLHLLDDTICVQYLNLVDIFNVFIMLDPPIFPQSVFRVPLHLDAGSAREGFPSR